MNNEPTPTAAPAAEPAPAPAAEPQPVVGNPFAGQSAAAAPAKAGNKTTMIILCVVGGLLVLIGIIIAVIFIAGNKTLSCEQSSDFGDAYKMTAKVDVNYFFGNINSMKMTEDTWVKEKISDEDFERAKSGAKTYDDKEKYNSWEVVKVDDNTIRMNVDVKITDENTKNFKTYDEGKKTLEDSGFTCK